ncbi:SRPBCC family protein [Curtobacterium herbarum]|uniref:Cyclase n=1 Tax=Curtobacterium herbarum TaxID=150122 RepID=A0ABN1ZF47_9MICO|nr:SRPBCC family protein [Curtobacterium herbarum]MBM7474728.1 ligand-binding SRPBCC domain-containing protein [Curtobacterium herbarum]MCS6545378.1 SRPBCC family protein [Curtobacterium herbarum]
MSAAFRIVTDLPVPPERAFALSLDIGAHLRSMAATGEQAIAGTTDGLIGIGESVTWRARHFGIVWRMTNEITALEAPHAFVDEQVRGPFARFRHHHRFEATPTGTRMVDEITFRAPFGVLGRIAEGLVLRRYLMRLIRERNRLLAAELAGPRTGTGTGTGTGATGQGPASSPSVS